MDEPPITTKVRAQASPAAVSVLPDHGVLRPSLAGTQEEGPPPPGGDDRDRAKFQKAQSYMVLLDDKVACKNMRCRKRFDISGVNTTAYLVDTGGLPKSD
jgi:hypothetical protein